MSAEENVPDTGLDQTDAAFVADRVDVFKAAHALVRDYDWAAGLDVVDVIRVAEFLAGDGVR
jgi:hypothetical protein